MAFTAVYTRVIIAFFAVQCGMAEEGVDPDMELPDIDAVLAEATGNQEELNAKVAAVEAHAAQKHAEGEAILAKKKGEFEAKLATQSKDNKGIAAGNDELRKTLGNLQKGNEALLEDTKKVRFSNRLLRSALVALQPKMEIANEFLGQALRISETNETEELNVLKPPVPEPTLDHFLEVMRSAESGASRLSSEQEEGHVSLLEVSKFNSHKGRHSQKPKEKGPEEFVDLLSQGLDTLEQAHQEGFDRLKAQFLAQYEVGQQKTDMLQETQNKLRGKIDGLQARQESLHSAKMLVDQTHEQLLKRVEAVRSFVLKADQSVGDTMAKANAIVSKYRTGAKGDASATASDKANDDNAKDAKKTDEKEEDKKNEQKQGDDKKEGNMKEEDKKEEAKGNNVAKK